LAPIVFFQRDCFQGFGFIIDDEEQRFGVEQKEKIKELKDQRRCFDLDGDPDSPDDADVPRRDPAPFGNQHRSGIPDADSNLCDALIKKMSSMS
jgi:hypothetical protein